jgi:hypothetical protein
MKRITTGLAIFLGALAAASGDDWFPFPIPVLADRAPAFDLSGLNERPAGASGWLRVEGERFVDGRGRELRLFGVNLTAAACFPEPDQAGPLARHLARFGCNIVRLHFLDNQWGKWTPSLLPESNNIARDGLRADALARLDKLVAELRAAGIRINLNLHVGRAYPGWVEGLPSYSKGTGNFMPGDIAEFKAYCRALLEHVNPHTGLAYKDDPAIAVLEISNEDSLVNQPGWLAGLPEPFAGELRRQWTTWLRRRHGGDAALQAAWGVAGAPFGPERAPPLARWIAERHGGAEAVVEPLDGGGLRWRATRAGGASWHLQLGSGSLDVENGKCYEIAFRARAAEPRRLALRASRAGGDYAGIGLDEQFEVVADWRAFRFRLAPAGIAADSGARLAFSLLNQPGEVEIAGFSCRETSPGFLRPGQTLAAGTVPLPLAGAPLAVRREAYEFLAGIEIAFARGMAAFLKDELGCRALVAHSQVLFGGPLGARREFLAGDFTDTHGYWQHPSWTGKPWDRRNWTIGNTSQIGHPEGGTLAQLAMQRPFGKPHTVSEYDIPAPNDHSAEMWPMFAATACFQGWAGIYHYTFAHAPGEVAADRITGYFNSAAHPAKDGLSPAAAAMFRLGLVAPARERRALAAADQDLFDLAAHRDGNLWDAWRDLWRGQAGAGGALSLRHATGLRLSGGQPAGGPTRAADPPAGPVESDTGEWLWDRAGGVWILRAPAARAWCGRLAGRAWEALDTTCTVPDLAGPAPHATVTLVALDGKPVAASRRLLVTALRRAENPGMEWNESRTTVGDRWGGGPVRVLGLRASLRLPDGSGWQASPLNSDGSRRAGATRTIGRELAIDPADATIWWMLERE